MESCAICGRALGSEKEHAVLLIGRYGTVHRICDECEEKMDSLVASENAEEQKDAADYIYRNVFNTETGRCSPEVVEYLNGIMNGDSDAVSAARDAALDSADECAAGNVGAENPEYIPADSESAADDDAAHGEKGVAADGVPADSESASENAQDKEDIGKRAFDAISADTDGDENADDDDYVSQEPKKTSLAIRIIFFFIFLLIGGSVLAYGIMYKTVSTIVIGAIVLLIGIASVFMKD